jgi:hypothetical protein
MAIWKPTRKRSSGPSVWHCDMPIAAADGPDINATGASHLHGGADVMLGHMISRLFAGRAAGDVWSLQ